MVQLFGGWWGQGSGLSPIVRNKKYLPVLSSSSSRRPRAGLSSLRRALRIHPLRRRRRRRRRGWFVLVIAVDEASLSVAGINYPLR